MLSLLGRRVWLDGVWASLRPLGLGIRWQQYPGMEPQLNILPPLRISPPFPAPAKDLITGLW